MAQKDYKSKPFVVSVNLGLLLLSFFGRYLTTLIKKSWLYRHLKIELTVSPYSAKD
jgi:hypothetical protein